MPENDKNPDFELRSKKVRNIIGEIPSIVVRQGITSICLALLILLFCLCLIPYPIHYIAKLNLEYNPKTRIIKAPSTGIINMHEINNNGSFTIYNANGMNQTHQMYLKSDNCKIKFLVESDHLVFQDDILCFVYFEPNSGTYAFVEIPKEYLAHIPSDNKLSLYLKDKSGKTMSAQVVSVKNLDLQSDIVRLKLKLDENLDLDQIYSLFTASNVDIQISNNSLFKHFLDLL